jgi:hypothetical protein
MALIRTPNGFTPINMQGGAPFNGGAIRQFSHVANNANPIGYGSLVQLAGGNIVAATASPTSATRGLIGVCVGVSFTDPVQRQPLFAQSLPANAVNNGYTNIRIYVNDDPNQLYKIHADTVHGALAGGPRAVIGLNCAVQDFGVGATTGVSQTVLNSGAAWVSMTNADLAVRIVDVLDESLNDPWVELIVKINFGVHAYNQNAGRG